MVHRALHLTHQLATLQSLPGNDQIEITAQHDRIKQRAPNLTLIDGRLASDCLPLPVILLALDIRAADLEHGARMPVDSLHALDDDLDRSIVHAIEQKVQTLAGKLRYLTGLHRFCPEPAGTRQKAIFHKAGGDFLFQPLAPGHGLEFLLVILGATDKRAPQGFAPIAIGLCLTLIHLVSIPVTNTSVNPARSTGVAVFAGGWAIAQLWLFWIAPIVGGILGAVIYRFIGSEEKQSS